MKTAEVLLIEISAALRITRDGRLIALLEDIKKYLEANPRPSGEAPLDAPAGRLLTREGQLKKNAYMAGYMRQRRAKQKEAKLAIINSTSPDRNRTGADAADIGEDQTTKDQS